MTWNLNFGLSGDPQALEVIAALDADVVLLQEVGPEWEAALREGLSEGWPHMLFAGQDVRGGAGGQAVLSRLPLEAGEVRESPVGWFPSQTVTVQTEQGPLEVLNVHLVPPFTDGGRLLLGWWTRHDDRLLEARVALEGQAPDLIAGDFNANERERALRWLRREHGYESALPAFHPRAKTWRWPGMPAWRIDHVLVGPEWRAVSAEVHRLGGSDHWPVVVELEKA